MPQEIEIKIPIENPEEIVRRLTALGAAPIAPRLFEDNRLYDLPGDELARAGKLLRLRTVGDRAILTVKAAPLAGADSSRYKIKREAEVEVADPEGLEALLELAGFTRRWRYQKWRSAYRLDGADVLVDELPYGFFLEIESDPARIDAVAARLGFGPSDYVTSSYRAVHEAWCAGQGVPVRDMLFEPVGRPPTSSGGIS